MIDLNVLILREGAFSGLVCAAGDDGAIRDVLLDGSQFFYASTNGQSELPLRQAQADASFLCTYPRLVLEPVGMALIALMGLLLVRQQGVSRALPLLGALALRGSASPAGGSEGVRGLGATPQCQRKSGECAPADGPAATCSGCRDTDSAHRVPAGLEI